jgi:hypothetical protein
MEVRRVNKTTNSNRALPAGARLTVKEIRGLLTRISHDLVRSLGAATGAEPARPEAQPVNTRRFVESMSVFIRMN